MSDISLPSAEALSSMINTLKENPALLQSIASSLGMASDTESEKAAEEVSTLAEQKSEEVPKAPTMPPEIMKALPTILSLMNGEGKPKSQSEANREALLYALKPYLSQSRADAIEKIIRLSRIGDILSGL
jgi:hypothetical protein